jgi:hypothetical protein
MDGLKGRMGGESLVAGSLGTSVLTTDPPHHTAIVFSPWIYAVSNAASASSVSR